MRQGWRGGLVAGRAADLLAVASCGTVADPDRPVEAVPARYAATVAVTAVGAPGHFADLVARLAGRDPADAAYGLTFVAATEPLTTRLRTLTPGALTTFLTTPAAGPGRWVFVTPDHHRWLATWPWAMDTAFVGCTADAARALSAGDARATVSAPARSGRAPADPERPGGLGRGFDLDATG